MSDFNDIIKQFREGADKLGETVGNAAKTAVAKVENKTKEAKIRFSIREAEERIKANFEAIGESVYKSYKSGSEPEDFSAQFGKLDALEDEITGLKEQLCSECNLKICPECNEAVKKSDAYCPRCGVKIKDE
ncbi:MAG: zinc ribbon domain-containing protein [Clostridia bacterium]|nr:zinc ribbon domain-containing protein [Clostridia bacterium]